MNNFCWFIAWLIGISILIHAITRSEKHKHDK